MHWLNLTYRTTAKSSAIARNRISSFVRSNKSDNPILVLLSTQDDSYNIPSSTNRVHCYHTESSLPCRRQGADVEGPGSIAIPYVIQPKDIPISYVGYGGYDPSTSLWDHVRQLATPPKGFENFFPKKDGKKSSSEEAKKSPSPDEGDDAHAAPESKNDPASPSSSSENKNNSPFESFGASKKKKGKKTGGGGKNPNSDQQQNQLGGVIATLLLVLAVRAVLEEDSGGNGPEVTWSDFRNYMLEPGDVDRIVIINKKTARVYLKEGALGVPSHSSPSRGSKSPIIPSRSGDNGEDWSDGTVMEMGTTTTATPSSTSMRIPKQPVYHFHIGSVESFEEKLNRAQQDLLILPRHYVPVQYANETNWVAEAIKAAPILLMVGVTAYLLRGMGGAPGGGGSRGGGGGGGMSNIFQIGKSNAKKIKPEDVEIDFSDVAGCQEAKREIMEFVDFLKDSDRFTKLGAKIPKGALLCGPPGTGKTLLAKAVAGEASVPFYSISGSDFIEMFVGVGPSRVRDLFKEARANAPCIIFIDEIDAVGRKRGKGGFGGGNDERENTLNQLLVEMDGFNPSEGVVVLAGTNRADILDEALLRPGRFDRQVMVDKPDLQGRKEIFLVHLRNITLEGTKEDIAGRLAGLTPGFAGADIANLCNEAAIQAARRKGDTVNMVDFDKATDRIVGGLESNKIMSAEEKSIVAHHEAGHAVAGWFLEHADPLLKVTIIPRTSGALGYAQYLPKEVFLRTQEQIMDIVCMALAGRASEEIFFHKVTTGAADDLRRVTGIVYNLIQEYGMNDRVGQLAFPKDPNAMFPEKPYSDATAQAMDEEAKLLVENAYERTLNLLREKKDDVEKVAEMLLEKETITHDDVYELIGPRPFQMDKAYAEYISKRFNDDDDEGGGKKDNDNNSDKNKGSISDDGSDDVTLSPGLA